MAGRTPARRAHEEAVVILVAIILKLLCKVFKGIKGMGGIKTLVVFFVVVLYAIGFQMGLNEDGIVPMGGKVVGEFCSVVCLEAFNRAGEGLDEMVYKQCRRICAVFLIGFHITPSRIFINGGILEKMLSNDLAAHEVDRGNELYINRDVLP